jgi:hypothetical protein
MANEPNGTVDDPTGQNPDGDDPRPSELTYAGRQAKETIQDLVKDGKISEAQQIYDKMVSIGEFDKEKFPFKSLSAEQQAAE